MMTPHEPPEQEPVVCGGEANDPQRRDVAGRPRHRRVDVTPDRYWHRRTRADGSTDAFEGQCHHARRRQALQELAAFARFQTSGRARPAEQLTDRRRQLLAAQSRVLPQDGLDQIEFVGTDMMTDEIPGVFAHECLLSTLRLLNSGPFVQSLGPYKSGTLPLAACQGCPTPTGPDSHRLLPQAGRAADIRSQGEEP